MLTSPAISNTPMHHARFHARPSGGAEPQVALEAERKGRESGREGPRPRPGEAQLLPPAVAPERAVRVAPGRGAGPGQVDPDALARLAELAKRDREVRAHEAAHARVGGRYAGRPSYDYVVGPDGKRYAVAGQVRIDVSPEPSDPEATIAKMRVVRAAALAPADPSPADRQVAALADRLLRAAEADLAARENLLRAAAPGSQAEAARLARLAALFAQTALLPAPDPVVRRDA